MPINRTSDTKEIWRCSFSEVIAAGVEQSAFLQIGNTGAGQAISQSGGNLVITSGTTANAETIIRSRKSFRGNMALRYATLLSQRIANNNFVFELVDVIGDNLAFSATSATALVITLPDGHPFWSAANPGIAVGQSVSVGAFISTAGNTLIPGRYVIASATATSVTLTVSGFTSGATGRCSLFGYNFHRFLYDGTTATLMNFDAGRNGWASGNTSATINTTASPGHAVVYSIQDGLTALHDFLLASAVTQPTSLRGSRSTTIPDFDVPLFLQIRCTNGSSAPAGTTTWTTAFVSIEEIRNTDVSIVATRADNLNGALPVYIASGVQNTSAPSVVGARGHDNTDTAGNNPVKIGANARSTNVLAVADNDVANIVSDLHGRLVNANGQVEQLKDRNRITIATTTETTLIAAVASVRHVLYGLTIANRDTAAATIDIRDTTAGTIRETVVIPAGQTVVIRDPVGTPQGAVNTNWTAQLRAATTTNPVEISAFSYRVGY